MKQKKSKKLLQDRFIPKRSHFIDISILRMREPNLSSNYHKTLQNTLFSCEIENCNMFNFTQEPSPKIRKLDFGTLRNNAVGTNQEHKKIRIIPNEPERVLDAPDIIDDFYLNLLDLNKNDTLAVGIGSSVHLYQYQNVKIHTLSKCEEDDHFTSVNWKDERFLAVATQDSLVQVYDVEADKKIREFFNYDSGRVGTLSWNDTILTYGSKDGTIVHRDVRMDGIICSTRVHSFEVCGLKWSPDGNLLASGGNDNLLNIWNKMKLDKVKLRLEGHTGAVKAISWHPNQKGLVATGGGTADKTLKFWDIYSGQCLNSIFTDSQVSSIIWSKCGDEFVTAHGFCKNQISVWKYKNLEKITDLIGHYSRVLYMAQSPDGTMICSGSGDETIRFWKVFEPLNRNIRRENESLSILNMQIR